MSIAPKKKDSEEVSETLEVSETFTKKDIHHIFRGVSKSDLTSLDTGAHALEEIEAYLNKYMGQGYRLAHAFFLGETPDAYMMLYIMVRD